MRKFIWNRQKKNLNDDDDEIDFSEIVVQLSGTSLLGFFHSTKPIRPTSRDSLTLRTIVRNLKIFKTKCRDVGMYGGEKRAEKNFIHEKNRWKADKAN